MQRLKALLLLVLLGLAATPLLKAQTTETYTFTTNRVVPDGSASGLSEVRNINSAIGNITSLKVRLKITGEYNGDLYAYLRHASGFTVLLNRSGRTVSDRWGYADSGFNVTFQNGAANGDIHVYQNVTTPDDGSPLTGTWQPDGRLVDPTNSTDLSPRTTSLTNFNGMNAAGEWTLYVADVDFGATNMLNEWALEITGTAYPTLAWTTPADIVYGTALDASQLNATATYNGTNVPGTLTYTPAAATLLDAGPGQTLSVTFTPTDSTTFFPVTTNVTINVQKAPLTIAAVDKSKVYGAELPTLTATYSGFVNGDDASDLDTPVTLGTTASASSPVGAYAITASDAVDANYTITHVNGTLTISPATLIIAAVDKSKIYGAELPTLTASYSGFVNGDDASDLDTAVILATAASASSPVGTYTIAASGAVDANYTITHVNGTLTVTPATLTITADDKSKVYGATLPTLTASYTGFVNGDDASNLDSSVTLATAANASSPVGTYTITASGGVDANYTITHVNGTLTVTPATLTIAADDKSKVYGAALPALSASYSGFVNGDDADDLDTAISLSTTASASSPVGTYTITASGAVDANYTITHVNGTLTVTPAALTITAVDKSKVYGAALPTLTASYSGFVNGDDADDLDTAVSLSTTASASSLVGTYTITASGAVDANYTITHVNGTLTVTSATITIAANDKTKAFGQALPELTASYSGFVLSEGTNDLTALATLTTTATATSEVGTYPITASGATSPNYAFIYVGGTLTITQALSVGVVASSANPALPGATVTFSMTLGAVAPGAGTPTGTVNFRIDGSIAGSDTLEEGLATFSTDELALGTHTIVAEYAGDLNFVGTTNVLAQEQVINTPPVAGNDTIERYANEGVKVRRSVLLTNDSDADADTLSVTFSTTSANGGTITVSGGWVFYTPAAGFTNADSFTYTITDGRGGSAVGTVTVAIAVDNAPSQNLTIMALGGGSFLISGNGIPGYTYRLQFSNTTAPFEWQELSTVTADENGRFQYTDTSGAPIRIYRTVYP